MRTSKSKETRNEIFDRKILVRDIININKSLIPTFGITATCIHR